jgi:hypothetical protein
MIEGMEGLAAQAMDDLLNDSEDKLMPCPGHL